MMSLELYALCNLEILTDMVENRERDFFVDEEEKQSVFSLQNIWSLFCLNWYWVLISALLCLTVAFVYLRYKEPVYSASMKVLVKDAEQKNRGFSVLCFFS